MAVWVRLLQNNIKSSPNFGKYYAKAVSTGEATLNDLMKDVQKNTALKEADVVHVVKELHAVMKRRLADGQTIDIEEIGRFRLSVESECVDDKKKFNIHRHIRRVICKFLPASHRRRDGTIQYDFCQDVEVKKSPF